MLISTVATVSTILRNRHLNSSILTWEENLAFLVIINVLI